MSSPATPQHEPTMEEILASIRKIISEDAPEQSAADTAELADDGDVLELTEEISPAPDQEPVLELVPEPQPEPAVAPEQTIAENDVVFEDLEEPSMTEAESSDIFSDKTRSALDDAFASLDEQDLATPQPSYVMPEGDSVQAAFERAVRSGLEPLLRQHLDANTGALIDQMKPLIRDWMDEHFPSLLENAVRTEVSRAVKARGRRA
ncbi:MAG TPA: DUF2497 domain-containing protein [Rhizomicrobium sp.]|nr:DUF2497 domain-containing protein [Rhizomicrobium sp.]